jgi:hypothetical protein
MLKLRTTSWDDGRVARVMAEYAGEGGNGDGRSERERFWRGVARRAGEREDGWSDVERVVSLVLLRFSSISPL